MKITTPVRVLSRREAGRRLGVHAATVDRWATQERYADLKFPALVRIGEARLGVIESELEAWIVNRPRIGQRELEEAS